ncbi:transposase IS4 family protein [Cupriavidus sp. GA3-3]|nr:transposase IS4 family protein [Cupriavidus sp. GA3-3]
MLATSAHMAEGRCLGPLAPSTSSQAACSGPPRLVTCRRRFFFHPCRGVGSKTGPNPTDRARPGSKHHLLTDAQGIPLSLILTGANRNDITTATADRGDSSDSWQTWSALVKAKHCPGRSRIRPRQVPQTSARRWHCYGDRPSRRAARQWSWQDPLGRRTNDRLAAQLQAVACAFRAPSHHPRSLSENGLLHHLLAPPQKVILLELLRRECAM